MFFLRRKIMRVVITESTDKENGKIPLEEVSLLLETYAKKDDFWILPEAFDTGWNIDGTTKISGEKVLDFMKQSVLEYKISICGSFYLEIDGKFFNRFYVVTKDGRNYFVDKRHLFGVFEKTSVEPGKEILNFEISDIIFRAVICYDLRFPVWCRQNDKQKPYDALICVSQWPKVREFDRDLLLGARALENVSFAINSNALGGSKIFSAEGKLLAKMPEGQRVMFYDLDKQQLSEYRKHKKYLSDADDFQIF